MTVSGFLRRLRSRRFALAAAGLGATVVAAATVAAPSETVASFVDNTFANSQFSASKWNVQGNAFDSNAWADHPSTSPAIFQPAVGNVVPGSTRSYSRFGLRMAPGSSTGATVTIPVGVEVSIDQATKFRMRVVRSNSDTCNSGSFDGSPTFVVGSSTLYPNMLSGPETGAGTITLAPGSPTSNPGAAVYLCYEFSLPLPIPTGLTNGAEATVRWTFTAVSS